VRKSAWAGQPGQILRGDRGTCTPSSSTSSCKTLPTMTCPLRSSSCGGASPFVTKASEAPEARSPISRTREGSPRPTACPPFPVPAC